MLKSSDKDLLRYIALAVTSVGMMLGAIHFLGEVHGLIITVVALIIQFSRMAVQLQTVQRELQSMRERTDRASVSPEGSTQ